MNINPNDFIIDKVFKHIDKKVEKYEKKIKKKDKKVKSSDLDEYINDIELQETEILTVENEGIEKTIPGSNIPAPIGFTITI